MSTTTLVTTSSDSESNTPTRVHAFDALSLVSLPESDTATLAPGFDFDADSDLPSYSPPAPLRPGVSSAPSSTADATTHQWSLTNRNQRPWATLKLKSRARATTHRPYFFQGDILDGEVELNLERPDSIRAIEVEVTGMVAHGAMESYNFIHISKVLWSSKGAVPSQPSTPSTSSTTHNTPPLTRSDSNESSDVSRTELIGQLTGFRTFPFCFILPDTVSCAGKYNRTPTNHPIPPTFVEKDVGDVFLQYTLVAYIRRTKFKVDSKLSTVFGFTPLITPPQPSLLRQLAYQEDSPLLGPSADPDGWHVLPTFKLDGTLFGAKAITIDCTLSVAQPLAYTRGTSIPLSLTLRCADRQALDIFYTTSQTPSSSPPALAVRLLRHVSAHPVAAAKVRSGYFDPSGRSKSFDQPRGKSRPMGQTDWNVVTTVVEGASFWPCTEGDETERSPDTRVLDGQIFIPLNLKPNTSVAHFDLWYTVVVYPPASLPGFTPFDPDSLASLPVSIATAYPNGPRPRMIVPPAYGSATRQEGRSWSRPQAWQFSSQRGSRGPQPWRM